MMPTTMTVENRRKKPWIVWAFFAALLLLGILVVRDYGISVDEVQSRFNGMVSLKYLADRFFPSFVQNHNFEFKFYEAFPLKTYYDRDYGVAFELPVTIVEHWLGLMDERDIYLFRHFCTFLVCLGGVGAIYQLATRRFGDWRIGLLGALMLVLSPRLFAEFFYNDKDAVFMALFAIGTNTAVAFIQRPSWGRAAWHALACALTIDVRIMGVILPLATLALAALQTIRGVYAGQRALLKTGAYLALMVSLVVLMWPFLWDAPWAHFMEAFQKMAKFRWKSDVLYRGSMIPATELPWHYALVWIGITTPVLYVLGFLMGAFLILRQAVIRKWRLYDSAGEWQDLLFLGLTLAPIAAVIALHSVLYDGWRQVYFVYPSLVLVALRGLVAVGRWCPRAPRLQGIWAWLRYTILGGSLLAVAGQMVAMHPLQNVYFNMLASRHLEERYELDYWVLSYRQGLEWIAKHDDRLHIRVSSQMRNPLESNRWMLDDYSRSRLEAIDDVAQADYFITTYRYHPGPYIEFPNEVATIRAGGNRILSIFRLNHNP